MIKVPARREAAARQLSQRRGVLSILTGTAVGQLLALLCSPLLARIYTPSDFGTFAIVTALSATVGTVAALRLELAVPLPDEERDALSLTLLGLGCALLTATLTTLVVALAGNPLATAFHHPELASWLWFVGPMAGLTGLTLVLSQLAVRQRRYSGLGRRNLVQGACVAGAQIMAGAAGLRSAGLLLGLTLGQVTGAASLLHGSGLNRRSLREASGGRNLVSIAWAYRRFPLLLAPSGLINVLGLQLPILIVAFGYGNEVAGWLSLTQRILAVPVTLLGTAIAQVYLGELVSLRRVDASRATALFNRATKYLLVAALPAAGAAALLGPPAFTLVFGESWTTSGSYARPLALALAAQLVAAPLSQTLIALEQQMVQLCWDIGRLLLVAGSMGISALLGAPAIISVWALSGALAVSYAVLWILSHHHLRVASEFAPSPSSGRAAAVAGE